MKISVVMAAFNGARYIEAQILSILQQLRANDEIIVSIDESEDKTREIVENIKDPRICVVEGPNSGINQNFMSALNHATGDAILFSDQDDKWLPGRVDLFLEKMKIYDFVFFDAEIINEHNEIVAASYFDKHNTRKTLLGNFYRCRTLGCCIGFNKHNVRPKITFHNSYEKLPFDYSLTLIALALYKCYFTTNAFHQYRRHDNNVSSGGDKSKNSFLKMLTFRIRGLAYIISHWSSNLTKRQNN